MKIETLKDRIKKAEEKKVKLNGTLERHQKQLEKKAKVLIDKEIDPKNCDRYDYAGGINSEIYWAICDYDSKSEDIKNNEKKIAEVETTLKSLKEQLENQLAKENEVENSIPEVLNTFLENWKQKCFEYYTKLANNYIEVISKKEEDYDITREELKALKRREYNRAIHGYEYVDKYTNEQIENILKGISTYDIEDIKYYIRDRHIKDFRNKHFASDMSIVDDIVENDTINDNRLNKILDYDVKVKKEMFISRIKEVIGEIKDLTGLRIGNNGEINGIAKGVKCNAKVETITAGGWNIQCYHFRVLVNTIK